MGFSIRARGLHLFPRAGRELVGKWLGGSVGGGGKELPIKLSVLHVFRTTSIATSCARVPDHIVVVTHPLSVKRYSGRKQNLSTGYREESFCSDHKVLGSIVSKHTVH